MITQTYFETNYLTITWNAEINGVEVQWRGFVQGEPFREGMNRALELVREKKAARWLADLREQRVTSLEDQDWVAQDWMPRCVQSGVQRSALILPQFALSQMAVRRIVQQAGELPFEQGYFDNPDEARQWLQEN